jgi:hypothetical protein
MRVDWSMLYLRKALVLHLRLRWGTTHLMDIYMTLCGCNLVFWPFYTTYFYWGVQQLMVDCYSQWSDHKCICWWRKSEVYKERFEISTTQRCPLGLSHTQTKIVTNVQARSHKTKSPNSTCEVQASIILYIYIRMTHYKLFSAILLTCKMSTSSTNC